MRRKTDTPTRGEVTERVEKNKEDMTEKVEELDTIATDTETVRETLENLDFDGTVEGVDAVEAAVEQAEDVTVEIFDGEDQSLEEIQSEAEEHEGELEGRSDSSESDYEKVSEATDQVATADTMEELGRAKAEIRDDIDFLNEQNETAKEAHEESERLQQAHRDRVHGGGGDGS